jgi:hypothetical protein
MLCVGGQGQLGRRDEDVELKDADSNWLVELFCPTLWFLAGTK